MEIYGDQVLIMATFFVLHSTSRIALAHYEALLVEGHRELIQAKYGTLLLEIGTDLKDSLHQITKVVGYLSSKNQVENIPLSV
jgi:hypothetical protein